MENKGKEYIGGIYREYVGLHRDTVEILPLIMEDHVEKNMCMKWKLGLYRSL